MQQVTKFDIHTNLGLFPGSESGGKDHVCTKEELAAHCSKYQLTHAMVLYPWNDYQILEDCQKLTNTKLYGIQCMFFNEKIEFGHQPELSEVEIHSDKPLWAGVKFHSHRGWYNIDGTIQNGIDYADTRMMSKVLKRLPDGAIVSTHLQGTASPYNTSRALSIGNLACKFPMLKFLINHAGDYGVTNAKPSYMKDYKTGVYTGYMDTLLSYCQSRAAFHASVEFANHFHNVYLDASNFVKQKGEILSGTKKWCIGTDIPFGNPSIYSFDNEYKKFASVMPEQQVIDAIHNTLDWFEKDVDVLLKEMAVEQNMKSQRLEDGSKI